MTLAERFAETRTYDMREEPRNCYRAVVHEPHDYDDVVWCEPRAVNPRTVWQYACPGVRDESPYPARLDVWERGVKITRQDEVAPAGSFAMIRNLSLSPAAHPGNVIHIGMTLWKKPPREFPPMHVGDTNAGMELTRTEAIALRDYLNDRLADEEQR